MRALIDTCVIVDALQSCEPFKKDAEAVFLCSANKSFDAYITAKSVTDIYYLTHKITHSDSDTRKILTNLFVLFEPLDTNGLDCRKAVSSEIPDYEDAVMVETAIHSEMDCIVTRNVRDYSKSTVPVYQPPEFLSMIHSGKEE